MASEWPLRPKTSHFRSPVCSSHVRTPHNASMNDPVAGLGLHQLGRRAKQWLAWKLKVGRRSSPWLVDPNCANKLCTQFKAPCTSSECKILGVIFKPLTFAGNSAFWRAVWGPVRILHPFWQGKGTFLNLPRSNTCCRISAL
jgi:hypothetical protein